MPKATIYHNPRCSQSRQALALLEQHGYHPEVIEYLKIPPSIAQLKKILKLLKIKPRELMRVKEKEYGLLKLENLKLSDAELIQAMHDHPILIQRPIVIMNDHACISRPPETLLKLL